MFPAVISPLENSAVSSEGGLVTHLTSLLSAEKIIRFIQSSLFLAVTHGEWPLNTGLPLYIGSTD